MIDEKQYIGSQQHWEDSINEDYDRQEQYAKDMEKEMHPQQEEPYPIDFYIHEIKQQSEYITSLLSENKRLKEALGGILSAFDKFKVSGPHLEENPFYTLRKTDLEGIIGKAPVTTVNPDNDDMR